MSKMVRKSELLINTVRPEQAEEAFTLAPKGEWSGTAVTFFAVADVAPSVERQDLSCSVAYVERGKPVALPSREGQPQGRPTGMQAKDQGKRERFAVMAKIEIADHSNIISRETGQTSLRGLSSRENLKNRPKGESS